MTESAFITTSRILSESANSFDLLRIIAGDDNHLDPADRETMRLAADELESSQRAHYATYLQLIETQAKLIAANERLIEARKGVALSYSTGWFKAEIVK